MTSNRFLDPETSRLKALASYRPLEASPAIDALTRLAARACGVPIALVTLVDSTRQLLLASVGLSGPREMPREHAFCAHAIRGAGLMQVEDARRDPRFAANPLVTGAPHIRSYAGVPLVDGDGFALGALCVLDVEPRALTAEQGETLRELAVAVMELIAARRTAAELRDALVAAGRLASDLDLVLDAMPAMVAYTDRELQNRFSNAAYAELFGRSRAALRGMAVHELVAEVAHRQDLPRMQAALRGERQSFEWTKVTPHGERVLEVVYVPDVQAGEVRGFVTTLRDITEQKEAMRAMERRNALLAMAEEVADIGHWRLEVDGPRLFWSPHVYAIHERDPTSPPSVEDAIGHYHPDDRATVERAVGRAIDHGESFDFDLRLLLSGGRIRRVHARGRAELDAATGRTRAVFGVFQDVSEREALRDRIKREERLVTTGTLAAGVGHEINNPLTYVTANVDFALHEIQAMAGLSPSGRMREVLGGLAEAREGAERIRKIVRGLRAFAREGTVAVPTDVRATIEVSASMAMHELRQRATLVIDAADARAVLADESRLSQVFVNLLVNAAQSFVTPDPQRNQVRVSATNVAGDRVAIEFTDNGTGIRDEILGRIFDPFFTTKDIGDGTGLGLAICQSIVSSLGGELTVRTELGEGTTFRVVLPAANPEIATLDRPNAAHPPPLRGRVLLVDDEEAILRAQQRVLSKEYEVALHSDPREACRRLVEQREVFDVVFCDLMMPQMSGMELYRRVALVNPLLASRFVFVTGGGVNQEARAFLADVPNHRLEKPYDSEDLRNLARLHTSQPGRPADSA